MTTVTLTRTSDTGKETLGMLAIIKDAKNFSCKTLELPWKENTAQVSCIPKGTYPCKYTRSNRLSAATGKDFYTYEVLHTAPRAGIRIHSANYAHQLLGCIALGNTIVDIDGDHIPDIANSKDTIAAFEQFMGRQDFTLVIK